MALSSKTLPAPPPIQNLEHKIMALHAEIEAYINTLVEREAKGNPGVPAVVIRQNLMTRAGWCTCVAYAQNPERA